MSQSALLRARRFLPLFLTQFSGAFNDNFFKNSLVILVTFQASAIMGLPASEIVVLAGGIFILPFFLFSATAGQLADKYEKTFLIKIVKVAEIAIMALAAAGFLTHHFELLLAVLFLMGMHSTIFGPIKYSILPQHLGENELVGGNALVEAGTFVAILLGTIAGGVLISIPDTGPTIVSVGLLATAIAGWVCCLFIPKAPAPDPSATVNWSPITPTIEIIRFARSSRNVFLAIMSISWFWLFGAAFLALFPVYAKDVLHADHTVVTLFLACFSIGIAIGSLLCEAMSRQRLELGLVPLGSIGMSLFAFDLFWIGVPSFVAAHVNDPLTIMGLISHGEGLRIVIDLVLLSVASGFFIVPLYTFIQIRSEPAHRSRIIAANNIINSVFMVASAIALVLFMKAGLTVPQIFCVLGAMNIAVAAYVYAFMPEFLLRFFAWMLASVMYRLKVTGHENIPRDGAVVLVANHISFVDWLIVSAAVKRPASFVMDHTFYKGWIGRTLLRQARAIPIASAKENPAMLERAFDLIAAELKLENVVCIFPEGQITKTGEMNVFRPGIERIVKTTPVTVVPMAICNMWGSFFSRKDGPAMQKKPARFWTQVEVRIGKPVAPQDVSAAMLFDRVKELLE